MKNFKGRNVLLSLLSAGVLSLVGYGYAKADFSTTNDMVITNGEVILYDSTLDNHEIVGGITVGEEVERFLIDGDYSLVRNGKRVGFVLNSDITPLNYSSNNTNTYEEISDVGECNTSVNLRSGPSTDYKKVDTLNNGTRVEIIGKSSNGWYLVDYNNKLGFMCGDYIDVTSDEELNTDEFVPEVINTVTATTTVNIRREPTKDSEDLGDLRTDESLDMVTKLDNGWYEVIYNGERAYVKGEYVKETYRVNNYVNKIVYFNKKANVYRSLENSDSYTVPKYEAAYIYGSSGNYYYGMVDNDLVYFYKKDVNQLSGNFVIIDISDQKLRLYINDNEEILCTDVVTGKDSSPTSIGAFKVGSRKTTDTYLIGPGYKVHVDYWIPFNGGQGMHDMKSRKKFGGNIYHKNGSHGCVNMRKKDVEVVYNNLDVGDRVLVKK